MTHLVIMLSLHCMGVSALNVRVLSLSPPALGQHSAKRFLEFTAGSYNAPVDLVTAILSTQKTQK